MVNESHVRANGFIDNVRHIFGFIDQQTIVLTVSENMFGSCSRVEFYKIRGQVKINI